MSARASGKCGGRTDAADGRTRVKQRKCRGVWQSQRIATAAEKRGCNCGDILIFSHSTLSLSAFARRVAESAHCRRRREFDGKPGQIFGGQSLSIKKAKVAKRIHKTNNVFCFFASFVVDFISRYIEHEKQAPSHCPRPAPRRVQGIFLRSPKSPSPLKCHTHRGSGIDGSWASACVS